MIRPLDKSDWSIVFNILKDSFRLLPLHRTKKNSSGVLDVCVYVFWQISNVAMGSVGIHL